MSVGHGRLGLRSGLRPYSDLISQSAAERFALVEMRPGRLITSWSVYSGTTWVAGVQQVFGGITRDVVAVRTALDAGLARVETLADCVATAGTFFYDPEAATSDVRWGDGVTHWTDGVTRWGQFPKLHVHLFSGADPNITSVEALLGFYFAPRGVIHPDLGTSKATSLGAGAYSFAAIAGAVYRISGAYSYAQATAAAAQLSLYSDTDGSGVLVQSDGRSTGAPTVTLAHTQGETRRFVLDFVAARTDTYELLLNESGAGSTISYSGVKVQRVWRFNYYEPRLSASAVPSTQTGTNDIFFGGKRVGSGAFALDISDGGLDAALGSLDWLGKEARVYAGGGYDDGEEVLLDDYRRTFTGLIQRVSANDDTASFTAEDARTYVHRKLPGSLYSLFEMASASSTVEGKARPLLFGAKTGITPPLIDRATAYGVYEVADTTDAPNGIKAIDAAYAYADQDAATRRDTTARVLLALTTDYTVDLAAGRLTIVNDVGPFMVVAGSTDRLDFDLGGSPLSATLVAGAYTSTQLATHVAAMLTAAAGTAIACAFSNVTHFFTVSKAAGTLTLLLSTGTSKDRSAWKLLGFTGTADLTGALTYTSTDQSFTDAGKDHILRCDAQGFKDDSVGSYTGTPSALIATGPDIVKLIWRRYLGLSLDLIDAASFAAAVISAPQPLGIYLGDQVSTKDIFDRIELSCLSDIVIDGSGVAYFTPYAASIDADAPTLYARDMLASSGPTGVRSVADVYPYLRVQYDLDPSTGSWKVRTADNPIVKVRFGRQDPKNFETYLTSGNDAQARLGQFTTLAASAPLRLTVTVKGKLLDRRCGQKVYVTRARAPMASVGTLAASVFRVLSTTSAWLTGETTAELVEDVSL